MTFALFCPTRTVVEAKEFGKFTIRRLAITFAAIVSNTITTGARQS
ncbi:hypothetical protein KQH60_07365 [Mycetohabitans sp. B8]|nr:hypothetical protein [Mycetohabitans sp. B8]MCG1042383.1 hypothetical protein [Mycetohabitans sp. B8]